ncbi:Ldh family oxidoreductase [Bradyrhizobium sp. CCGB01]|uniref:Ldh family oxidoreductase n=1 Tax=Bradyrhizobium sp. CCGB01 TaxID=2949634 RepID=UPI0020B44714|nr:Ldh family oxidoreductase [Bradyrhizobium sp. CCGB01]MCP3405693.1 Ldh family oxidoreductase [Bradyrhizobium sp. CCGB01]
MDENNLIRIPEPALNDFCIGVLTKLGVPRDDAKIVADNLIAADLRGVGSHGVVRLPIYIKRLIDGGTNARPDIITVRQTRTTAVVDGHNGLGHLVGVRAMEVAIKKASDGNCVFVAVRNSNHFGAAAYYAEMAARNGMIGLVFTIGAIDHMAPWGGAEAVLGNNPLAVAFPAPGDFPIVLDMACSVAARGKIIVAAKEGKPIPVGWATGPDGLPTTNAAEALKGVVVPVGGPKGYALTLTVGLLSTMLSGAFFGRDVGDLYEKTSEPQNSGHLFGVLPVAAFDEPASYAARMRKGIDDIKGVRRAPGSEQVFLPGEQEYLAKLVNLADGVPIGRLGR